MLFLVLSIVQQLSQNSQSWIDGLTTVARPVVKVFTAAGTKPSAVRPAEEALVILKNEAGFQNRRYIYAVPLQWEEGIVFFILRGVRLEGGTNGDGCLFVELRRTQIAAQTHICPDHRLQLKDAGGVADKALGRPPPMGRGYRLLRPLGRPPGGWRE